MGLIQEGSLVISIAPTSDAYTLKQAMWAGLRPKGFKEQEKAKYPEGMILVSQGEMDALKNHLNDFRALVGKTLEVDL